ncbi:MAG: ATP-binding cassette domain-containing protein [Bryobacteraceae bacterium]|nr:ATP-binding cassette domain-containing protein [Bryobacteraceae bacterium]
MTPICAASGLGVTYSTESGPVSALADVNLSLFPAEICGVLGPSGSGKSTLGLALAGLLPASAQIGGSITLAGHRIEKPGDWEPLRGRVVTYVPQEPGLALNPVLRAVTQVRDSALCALGMNHQAADRAARQALDRAGLSGALQEAYPHELSGGQRQRVLLARAFLLSSQLVVADEPTSALDAVTQREILRLFEELRASGSTVLLITHNPSILRGLATETVRVSHGRVGPREPLETAEGPAKCL